MRFRRTLISLLCLAVIVPVSHLRAEERGESDRQLTILEPEKVERLDPAFEMIMDKIDEDLRYVLSSPVRLTPRETALTGLTILGTLFLINEDEEYLENILDTKDERSDRLYDRFRVLGDHIPETAAGLYLVGYLADSKGLKSRSLESLEAVAITALISAGSSYIIGHKGPDDSTDSGDFEPLRRYRSMPDMRTSLIFSVAGVFAYEKHILEALLYYGIAAGTAVSQVYYEDAWPSDIFLGSILGTAIGRTVASRSRNGGESNVSLLPVLEHHSKPAIGLKVEFRL